MEALRFLFAFLLLDSCRGFALLPPGIHNRRLRTREMATSLNCLAERVGDTGFRRQLFLPGELEPWEDCSRAELVGSVEQWLKKSRTLEEAIEQLTLILEEAQQELASPSERLELGQELRAAILAALDGSRDPEEGRWQDRRGQSHVSAYADHSLGKGTIGSESAEQYRCNEASLADGEELPNREAYATEPLMGLDSSQFREEELLGNVEAAKWEQPEHSCNGKDNQLSLITAEVAALSTQLQLSGASAASRTAVEQRLRLALREKGRLQSAARLAAAGVTESQEKNEMKEDEEEEDTFKEYGFDPARFDPTYKPESSAANSSKDDPSELSIADLLEDMGLGNLAELASRLPAGQEKISQFWGG